MAHNNNASRVSTQTVRYCGEIVTVIGAAGTDALIVTADGESWVRCRDLSYEGASLVCRDLSCDD